jgi:hypothetical protein
MVRGTQSFRSDPQMKSLLRSVLFVLVLGFAKASPAQPQGARHLTTTLLPVETKAASATRDGLFWIRQNTDSTASAERDVFLQFDLGRLPAGLSEQDFTRVTLRLVAEQVVYIPESDVANSGGAPIIIKAQKAMPDLPVIESRAALVSLTTLTRSEVIATVAPQQDDDLRRAVFQQYSSANKKISFRLFSASHKASTRLFSAANFGGSQSNIPRLVIEYARGPAGVLEALNWTQYQGNPEHTGRNPWIPFRAPNGYSLVKFNMASPGEQPGTIADYPLIYNGNIYLVYKVLDTNYLRALDFKGKELWRRPIGIGTIQRSPVISTDGRMYVVTEGKLTAYDLHDSAAPPISYTLPGNVSDYTDVTIGNDGSLFIAVKQNDRNHIYAFTPELKPFLRAGPFGTGAEKISTITASADGRRLFAQIPSGAVVIDVVEPSQIQEVSLTVDRKTPWEYYHAPIAGPAGGVMIYSDFTSTANRGNVRGANTAGPIWSTDSTLIPQPVLGSDRNVYYLQNGALQAHPYDQVGSATSSGTGFNATSNLVLDGANNIYFWDNGSLRGYKPDGQLLFEKAVFTTDPDVPKPPAPAAPVPTGGTTVAAGPEQFLRLMLGPDGTLWANNRNGSSLYAFRPVFAVPNTVVTQTQTQTVYRATGMLHIASGVIIPAGTQTLFQAGKSVSFSAGTVVRKGAAVVIRTGF